MLQEARRGVRFDEMAILVRAPHQYHGLLEHALERARVPAWFDRGMRRPHPAGRAFLALLACAAEGLAAGRFAEYLSLGQLPVLGGSTEPTVSWAAPIDEALSPAGEVENDDETAEEAAWGQPEQDEDQGAVAGTLRTPRRWERMLVEASVIGGNPARWRRRLDGLRSEFETGWPRSVARTRPRPERRASSATSGASSTSPRSRCRWSMRWPHGGGRALGAWLERLERFAPRVLGFRCSAARARGLAAMATVGPGHGRRGPRRSRRAPAAG